MAVQATPQAACALPHLAAGEARNTQAMAMSHLRPMRPTGMLAVTTACACASAPGASLLMPAGHAWGGGEECVGQGAMLQEVQAKAWAVEQGG